MNRSLLVASTAGHGKTKLLEMLTTDALLAGEHVLFISMGIRKEILFRNIYSRVKNKQLMLNLSVHDRCISSYTNEDIIDVLRGTNVNTLVIDDIGLMKDKLTSDTIARILTKCNLFASTQLFRSVTEHGFFQPKNKLVINFDEYETIEKVTDGIMSSEAIYVRKKMRNRRNIIDSNNVVCYIINSDRYGLGSHLSIIN